jgi:hypothetical protein
MARTFFQDFTRDDGTPVTVEYSASGGEPNYDHPGHICDGGGSGPEIVILKTWPNTSAFEALCRRYNAVTFLRPRDAGLARRAWAAMVAPILAARIWWAERRVRLTVDENERMEAWLAEHYVDEPDYEDWDR